MIRLLALCLALCGCATCHEHPFACGVAGALVAGSIAASVQHHHDQEHLVRPPATAQVGAPACATGVCQ